MDAKHKKDITGIPAHSLDKNMGQGKGKPPSPLPIEVVLTRQKELSLPEAAAALLPPAHTPIDQLTQFNLPQVSSGFIMYKANKWFSEEEPNIDIKTLRHRPIPNEVFLRELDSALDQLWLGGARSVIDQRAGDDKERLPLWVLTYWKKMAYAIRTQKAWMRSCGWLSRQQLQDTDEERLDIYTRASELLGSVGWDAQLTCLRSTVTISQLQPFLSTAWLSTDQMDIMVEQLNERAQEHYPDVASKVLIVPLIFASTLSASNQLAQLKTGSLLHFEKIIREQKIEKIYFPANLGGHHWISGCINFGDGSVSFGDSLCNDESVLYPPPKKLMANIRKWLHHHFNMTPTYCGNSLPHGMQRDTFSCGLFVINTFAHALFGDCLLSGSHAVVSRIDWFVKIAKHCIKDNYPGRDSRITIESFLNPFIPDVDNELDDSERMSLYASDSDLESRDGSDVVSVPGVDVDIDDHQSDEEDHSVTKILPLESSDAQNQERASHDLQRGYQRGLKRKFDATGLPTSDDLNTSTERTQPVQSSVPGQSRSSIHARERWKALNDGTLVIDQNAREVWKEKLRQLDNLVEFDERNPRSVRHSICGEYIKMKDVGDTTRFKEHMKTCTPGNRKRKPSVQTASCSPSLFSFGFRKQSKEAGLKEKEKVQPTRTVHTVPCPGLTEAEDSRIPSYLYRTSASGGGSQSVTVISKERFGCSFSELAPEAKDEVTDLQQARHVWKNDHRRLRVFAASCVREKVVDSPASGRILPCAPCLSVLKNNTFRSAINRQVKDESNYAFTPKMHRDPVLGQIYARTIGVKEILETPDVAKQSPCVRYALGVLRGKYNNDVFNGLVEAVVTKYEKEERGVGMQNFKYAPAWDELCHIISTHSPRTYRVLLDFLPGRTIRSFRQKEAREPRFPMTICDRTFSLVEEHLSLLGYKGPVCLCCDDTKLLSTFRLYWDAKEQSHYIVGGVDGRYHVPNPEDLKKATKIRLWCLSIPIPGISPIIVAALPISDDMNAPSLFTLLETILDGLLMHRIQVVSYACDGTEVERSVQKLLVARASRTQDYHIPNPIADSPDIKVRIPFIQDQPICAVQDSKHALKTYRNNLFSGARLLVFGNHYAQYEQIHQIAREKGAPLYIRDVERLDRQDDNAAARLFSADTIQYLNENHPEWIGVILYLFVLGELIDAYQNRFLIHHERVKMVLRARFFLDAWDRYLTVAQYKRAQYFISREAIDITRLIIDGFLGLIYIFRDHLRLESGMTPFVPWLHSTEVCEHVFGAARQIVKDFTALDFFQMIPKLRIQLRHSTLHGINHNANARAGGYAHTYTDTKGMDLRALCAFPSDADIAMAAEQAAHESESLIALLGVSVPQLYGTGPFASLPSIAAWYSAPASVVGARLSSASAQLSHRSRFFGSARLPEPAIAGSGYGFQATDALPQVNASSGIVGIFEPLLRLSLASGRLESAGCMTGSQGRVWAQAPDWLSSTGSQLEAEPATTLAPATQVDEIGLQDTENLEGIDDEGESEAQELQELLDLWESAETSKLPLSCKKKFANLTCAALAVTADEATTIEFDEGEDQMSAEERQALKGLVWARETFKLDLPPVNVDVSKEPSKSFGQGIATIEDLSFNTLVALHRRNQTKQAATGVRTRTNSLDPSTSLRRKIIQEFHDVMNEYKDYVSTAVAGQDRIARWQDNLADLSRTGNSANAAAAATAVAAKAATRRKDCFTRVKLPHLSMVLNAGISALRPICLSDFVIAFSSSNLGLVLGQGNYISLCKVKWKKRDAPGFFQRIIGPQFRSIPMTTALLQTKMFELMAPIQILYTLTSKVKTTTTGVEMTNATDVALFNDLSRESEKIKQAIKLFNKRRSAATEADGDVVFAVRFTIQPNKWVKTLHKNTFWKEIKVKRTNIVAFYSSSLADKTSLSHYIEAAEQLHPLVSSFAVNCDKDLDESLCEELKINTKESLFRVSVMVFPRGTELKTVVLPEQTLLPKDIISQVQGAVPNYIVVLNDIKGITAWADKIREPAVKKQDKQKGLILDKVDKISNHDISAHVQSALVKEGEPKYRALLLVRAEVIPFSWRVLANQYYGKMSFGITLNANANIQKQLGLEKNMKTFYFIACNSSVHVFLECISHYNQAR
ncbi:hypothetical protein F5887DRAFT_1287968 [Amanita rubescens]|nr:hypothetical protein F5887DRAFT_1287968 [Amanita rubescens]